RTAIPFPFFEHDRPTESGLGRLEDEKFEVFAIVMNRHTPFAVVILQHERIVDADPGTSIGLHLHHRSVIFLQNRCYRTSVPATAAASATAAAAIMTRPNAETNDSSIARRMAIRCADSIGVGISTP